MKPTDWISIKDKLPKLGERVLVCRKFVDGSTHVDFASREKHFHSMDIWYTDEGWDIEDVTHWQKIVLPKVEL